MPLCLGVRGRGIAELLCVASRVACSVVKTNNLYLSVILSYLWVAWEPWGWRSREESGKSKCRERSALFFSRKSLFENKPTPPPYTYLIRIRQGGHTASGNEHTTRQNRTEVKPDGARKIRCGEGAGVALCGCGPTGWPRRKIPADRMLISGPLIIAAEGPQTSGNASLAIGKVSRPVARRKVFHFLFQRPLCQRPVRQGRRQTPSVVRAIETGEANL